MLPEDLLHRLGSSLTPSREQSNRIRARLQSRIGVPEALKAAHEALTPAPGLQQAVWARVLRAIGTQRVSTFFDQVRSLLTPPADLCAFLWQRFAPRLTPVPQESSFLYRGIKWVAAFVLLAFMVQLSPRLFISPRTAAEMQVTLAPTQGEVYVLMDNLWQPITQELKLEAGMRIKTLNGQASILLGDDGVARLDADTIVQLLDASDRLEPASELVPTMRLFLGRLWVQGLVPAHLRGITISASNDSMTVNEGSVSIAADEETVGVEVFDRRVRVTRSDEEAALVSGEWMQLRENNALMTKRIPEGRFEETWVKDNLGRDAVHRQEIAQMQQEKLAARAGILPTSTLYPVKRAAEAVDVFLTFGEEARIQKKLQYADQRLTEAAALIKEGETDAVSIPLEEYRSTLIALATGSGDGTLAQFLLQQAVVETTAEVSAALPGDAGYALKKVVLETSSALSHDMVPGDVQGGLLLDTLAVLTQAVEEGNVGGLAQTWEELQPQLKILSESGTTVSPDVRKETMAALGELATTLQEQFEQGKTTDLDPALLTQVAAYLPPEESGPPTLSESDVMDIVAGIRDRIFVYHLQQPRTNQFLRELAALQGHPDQGRILRRLYFVLPDGPENFPERVKQEMIRLQWQKAGER